MRPFKTYSRLASFPFPTPSEALTPFCELLLTRHSERTFSTDPVSAKELSHLLYYSAAIVKADYDLERSKRPYPSAGSKYPLEIYPLIFRVEDLQPGLYHYNVLSHSLELLAANIEKSSLDGIWLSQDWAKEAALILIITAVFGRITEKYGEQGLRYALIESGHLGQNVYLLSQEMGLSCCAIGELREKEINALLDINPFREVLVYFLAIGKQALPQERKV